MPHQDDETLFFASAICQAIEAYGPENIKIYLVSDGSGSAVRNNEPIKPLIDEILEKTERSSKLTIDKETAERASALIFSRMRTNEFNASMASMGITNIDYWNLPDSQLSQNKNRIVSLMDATISLDTDHNTVYFTYSPYYDYHNDHRAVGEALMQVYKNHQTQLQGKVFFIIKNEDDPEKSFKKTKYYKKNSFLIKNKSYYPTIEAAVNEYKFTADPDTDQISQELADLITNQGCTITEAIKKSKKLSSLRLAIGPNYSVREMFNNLDRNLKQKSLHTILHKPFIIE